MPGAEVAAARCWQQVHWDCVSRVSGLRGPRRHMLQEKKKCTNCKKVIPSIRPYTRCHAASSRAYCPATVGHNKG